ncbi:MAG: sulfatase-like hydrolase/transferase [Candidatus Lokiarchaeota archaeon]|nr:sulfatase-like hydrolase/transferase [Candidatus Lokiarchaeota archaeon]
MNTIVIMADSFRADHLGCYSDYIGPGRNIGLGPKLPVKTPNIDKLARESALFYHAYPEGVPTLPVRISLFTGRYTFPFRFWGDPEEDDILISEVLGSNGYDSCLVADTYHMRDCGYNRGFKLTKFLRGQEYDFFAPLIKTPFVNTLNNYKYRFSSGVFEFIWRSVADKQNLNNINYFGASNGIFDKEENTYVYRTISAAIDYLENRSDKSKDFFLWVDSFDPHEPWNPPEPFHRMYNKGYKGRDYIAPQPGFIDGYLRDDELYNVRALYAGEISLVDKQIGRFITYLKENQFLDDSLLIFISDHGEPFGERHGENHEPIIRKARPWLYEELMRIPLLIHHPDGIGAGKSFDSFALTCDIMPTILDFMGVKGPNVMDGKSLLPIIEEEKEKIRNYAFLGWFKHSISLRTKDYSFHRWVNEPPEFYDLKKDQYESENIFNEETSLAREYNQILTQFIKKIKKRHPNEKTREYKTFYLFDTNPYKKK